MDQIQVKIEPDSKPKPAKLNAWAFGHDASIKFGSVEIYGNAKTLAAELRRLAEIIEPGSVRQRHGQRISKEMPEAMIKPETAWPWLVKRFPWLFNEIDTSREPYAHYLKTSKSNDIEIVLATGCDANSSLADISQALTNERYYSGQGYKRVKAVQQLLQTSSSPAEKPHNNDLDLEQAA